MESLAGLNIPMAVIDKDNPGSTTLETLLKINSATLIGVAVDSRDSSMKGAEFRSMLERAFPPNEKRRYCTIPVSRYETSGIPGEDYDESIHMVTDFLQQAADSDSPIIVFACNPGDFPFDILEPVDIVDDLTFWIGDAAFSMGLEISLTPIDDRAKECEKFSDASVCLSFLVASAEAIGWQVGVDSKGVYFHREFDEIAAVMNNIPYSIGKMPVDRELTIHVPMHYSPLALIDHLEREQTKYEISPEDILGDNPIGENEEELLVFAYATSAYCRTCAEYIGELIRHLEKALDLYCDALIA